MCTFFAANHFHDFVQAHLANIDIVSRTLRYGGNAVAYFQPAIHLRGPAGNKALYFRVAIFSPKHGTDPH